MSEESPLKRILKPALTALETQQASNQSNELWSQARSASQRGDFAKARELSRVGLEASKVVTDGTERILSETIDAIKATGSLLAQGAKNFIAGASVAGGVSPYATKREQERSKRS